MLYFIKRNKITKVKFSIDSTRSTTNSAKENTETMYKQKETLIEDEDVPKAVITKTLLNEIISRHNKEHNNAGSWSSWGTGKCIIF